MKVAFIGANGKMGRSMMEGVLAESDIQIVGAVDLNGVGSEIAPGSGVYIEGDTETMIRTKDPDIVVDFTSPLVIKENVMKVLSLKKHVVVGTTGLSPADLEEIDAEARRVGRVVFVAPNFALGAVLMMEFSARAAKYFPHVEVIELHHDQKKDAPSGTAVKTLEMMAAKREKVRQGAADEIEKIPCSRGGEYEGMRVHSVRLPGYVAHQEVIFGGKGQTLTIRHDSMSRESFVAGLLLAIRSIGDQKSGLVYGLENIL